MTGDEPVLKHTAERLVSDGRTNMWPKRGRFAPSMGGFDVLLHVSRLGTHFGDPAAFFVRVHPTLANYSELGGSDQRQERIHRSERVPEAVVRHKHAVVHAAARVVRRPVTRRASGASRLSTQTHMQSQGVGYSSFRWVRAMDRSEVHRSIPSKTTSRRRSEKPRPMRRARRKNDAHCVIALVTSSMRRGKRKRR